jgi:hypothetical protein
MGMKMLINTNEYRVVKLDKVKKKVKYMGKIEVKLHLYRPWRPLELREVETPTFSEIRLTDGGKVVSPTRRPLFTPRMIPGVHFS